MSPPAGWVTARNRNQADGQVRRVTLFYNDDNPQSVTLPTVGSGEDYLARLVEIQSAGGILLETSSMSTGFSNTNPVPIELDGAIADNAALFAVFVTGNPGRRFDSSTWTGGYVNEYHERVGDTRVITGFRGTDNASSVWATSVAYLDSPPQTAGVIVAFLDSGVDPEPDPDPEPEPDPGSYLDEVGIDEPTAVWPLQADGNDVSGNARHLTVSGASFNSPSVDGPWAAGLLFDGSDDYAEVASGPFNLPGPLTYEAWCIIPDADWGTGGQGAQLMGLNDRVGIRRLGDATAMGTSLRDNSGNDIGPSGWGQESPILKGEWVHVCVVFDRAAQELRTYINGSSVVADATANEDAATNITAPWTLGCQYDGPDGTTRRRFFNGHLAYVAVYSMALSAARVQAHFDAAFAEPDAQLDAPTNLADSAIPVITVSWDAVADADSYDLERDGIIVASGLTIAEYTDLNVVFGTQYAYRIRTDKGGVKSEWSTVTTHTPTQTAPPKTEFMWNGTAWV
ncbi:MAG: LamG-like jellyroll fold domain-containing protein [Dermatophilaceae bacterium]|nr:LamG domain-containing protein [Intrasporangiaceae bacterium]